MADQAWELLKEIARACRALLGEALTGIYAHGSLAFGCFRRAVSDIDFLIVTERPVTPDEQIRIIDLMLEKTPLAPEKGFEMSVVLRKHLNPFVYPTPFEVHFSNAYLEECRKDVRAYCMRPHGGDPDLAAHCMVTGKVGRRVDGQAIAEVFGEVPWAAYMDSILKDVKSAAEEITENAIYMTLNLCRVLAAVREEKVLSKADGGRWGLKYLDARWKGLIGDALRAYEAGGQFTPDPAEAKRFAEEMLRLISGAQTE